MRKNTAMRKRPLRLMCLLCSLLLLLSGCTPASDPPDAPSSRPSQAGSSQTAAVYRTQVLTPTADGTVLYETENSALDASHAEDGYVMVAYRGDSPKVKLLLTAPNGTVYRYNLSADRGFQAFPLTEGAGDYTFQTCEIVSGEQYTTDLSQTVHTDEVSEFGPYLYPNQFVDFTADSQVVKEAETLAQGAEDDLDVLQRVYDYVVKHIRYDDEKAATVQSGYLPDPDSVLASGQGICFDYAAVMASMLRSLGIPTQLQVGYLGTLYHAWISTHIKGVGWVNGVIQFDGETWTLMDPTTAASKGEKATAEYLNTDGAYTAKFKY